MQKQQVSSAEATEYLDSIKKIFQQKISTKSNIIGDMDESIASSIVFYDPISDFWYPKWGRVCQEAHAKKTNFATPSHNVDFM